MTRLTVHLPGGVQIRRTRDGLTVTTAQDRDLAARYEDLSRRMWQALLELDHLTTDNEWREELHPRADDGRFGHGHGHPKEGAPEEKAKVAGGSFAALHKLLGTGKPFTRAQLIEACGIATDKKLGDYLAMLKNPKYAGKLGALKIEKNSDGTYQVKTAEGGNAPPNPEKKIPPAPPPRHVAPPPAPLPERKVVHAAPPPAPEEKKPAALTPEQYAEHIVRDLKAAGHEVVAKPVMNGSYIEVAGVPGGVAMERSLVLVIRTRAEALGLAYAPGGYVNPREMMFKVPQPAVLMLGTWKPAKNAREATRRAVEEGFAEWADFGTISADSANQLMGSVADHFAEFPALRKAAPEWGFGTNSGYAKHQIELAYQRLKVANPDKPDDYLQRAAKARKPRFSAKSWAYAWRNRLSGNRAVTVNQKFMSGSPEDIRGTMMRNVKMGFHPVGCDTIKSVMDHEMGHQLDYLLNLSNNPEVSKLRAEAHGNAYGPDGARIAAPVGYGGIPVSRTAKQNMREALSEYAYTNTAEFIAEAWAEVKNNPNPRPIAKRMGEIIRSEYAKHYGAAAQRHGTVPPLR